MAISYGEPVGSTWHRWDPHLHAPGTLLNDQFKGDWSAYFDRIERSEPRIKALGVTDYFTTRTYREVLARREKDKRLPDVALLFPNVELRLDVRTEKGAGINIHLLFSPEDKDHLAQIDRVLGLLHCEYDGHNYQCTQSGLIDLGRLDDKSRPEAAAMRAGANLFKVNFTELRKLFRSEKWLQKNCLVAVSGGKNDGTPGLQNDDSFVLVRREIERFADVVFASTPSSRVFWLGKKEGHPPVEIVKLYGATKPCLHGSDAHWVDKTGVPEEDRRCWLKGDLTFETLRQILVEPERRVYLGADAPADTPDDAIVEASFSDATWLTPASVPLSSGLVAIIGPRGSGKTALAELLARGARAPRAGEGDASFLHRAADLVGGGAVTLRWRSSEDTAQSMKPQPVDDPDDNEAGVRYLSQEFVDQLCSSTGLARGLRAEMERVIFGATPPDERLFATSLAELLEIHLAPVLRRRTELQEHIIAISTDVTREEEQRDSVPALKKELATIATKVAQAKADLGALMPKGASDKSKRLGELEAAVGRAEARVEAVGRRKQAIKVLADEVGHLRTLAEDRRLSDMMKRHAAAQLDAEAWKRFRMQFTGDVDSAVSDASNAAAREAQLILEGNQAAQIDKATTSLDQWPLSLLRAERDDVRKAVGIAADQQRKYAALQHAISEMETTSRKLDGELKHADGADGRRTKLIEERRASFAAIFDTFVEEERVLERLYEPLRKQLDAATGTLKKLSFFVRRRVDLDAWVERAERELFDLRRSTKLQGHGALKALIEGPLLTSLRRGGASAVAEAMESFTGDHGKDFMNAMPLALANNKEKRRAWTQDVATWVFSTGHIQVEYGVAYDGREIERLSPGTRGIVLLLLYLVIDRDDRRPLIVDQPEENLDPKSVYDDLVPHFRDARERRQVIIVTHNANLVVNTDVDQVIVASSSTRSAEELPLMSYAMGPLENPNIRKAVCAVLEGGERAFLERERRYRFSGGSVATPSADDAAGTAR